MYKGKKIAVVLVAAGQGTRMDSRVPKQFLSIGNTTILEKTARVFARCKEVDFIQLVLPADRELWPSGSLDMGAGGLEIGEAREGHGMAGNLGTAEVEIGEAREGQGMAGNLRTGEGQGVTGPGARGLEIGEAREGHGMTGPGAGEVGEDVGRWAAAQVPWAVLGKGPVEFAPGRLLGANSGGPTRQDSVQAGLLSLPPDVDYVLIHDGVRPYVTPEIIYNTLGKVLETQACVVAVPVKDTIRAEKTLDRSKLFAVQTPQAFEKNLILQAYQQAYKDNFFGTDDGMLVERLGRDVAIVEGSYENIKITTPEDLPRVNSEASEPASPEIPRPASPEIPRPETPKAPEPANPSPTVSGGTRIRTGLGFDVHSFTPDSKLILGGIEIPWEKGLLGHSDADVLTHSIMDALLGAAALGDIGYHFPDSDPKYKGISSIKLLVHVGSLLREKGYNIVNIDAVVILQAPKIAQYKEAMAVEIAKALGIDRSRVNIKASTTEWLGFVGRGQGASAQAVATIEGI